MFQKARALTCSWNLPTDSSWSVGLIDGVFWIPIIQNCGMLALGSAPVTWPRLSCRELLFELGCRNRRLIQVANMEANSERGSVLGVQSTQLEIMCANPHKDQFSN